MKLLSLLLFLMGSVMLHAQIAPFVDFNGYFKTFYKNNFRQLEYQRIKSYDAGDNMVAYIDSKGDFKVYDGEKVTQISNMIVQYQLSDDQIAWNIGPGLYYLKKNGQKELLTMFARNYRVMDSLIVFEDTRFNTVSVVYKEKVYPLYQYTGELSMPVFIGEDIIAYKDIGDNYKVFWKGRSYELGVWMSGIEFSAGTGIVTFNDPTHRTFAVFENGEFMDLEDQYVSKYRAGRGFAVYEDVNGNLWYYQQGKKVKLTDFSATSFDVKDDLVMWMENGMTYVYYQGEKIKVATYAPKDYLLKNGVLAFRNIMGGVSCFVNGKVTELTLQQDATYAIYGNTILVGLFNQTYLVFSNGKIYES